MRSFLLRSSLFLVLFVTSNASGQGYDWAHGLGNSISTVRKMVFDNKGNILCLVYFFDSIQHDKTYYSHGESDVALLKFSKSGEPMWGTSIGGANSEEGISMACDSSGNMFIKVHSISDSIAIGNSWLRGNPAGRHFFIRFDSKGELWRVDTTTGNGIGVQPFRGFMECNNYNSIVMLDWCDGDSVVFAGKRIDRGYFISSANGWGTNWAYPWHNNNEHVVPKALAARTDKGFYIASDFSQISYYHPFPITISAKDSFDVLIEWYGPSSYLEGYTTFGGPTDDHVLAMRLNAKNQPSYILSYLDSLSVGDTLLIGDKRRSNVYIKSAIGSWPYDHSITPLFDGELNSASICVATDTGFSVGGLVSDSFFIAGTEFKPEENKAKIWTAAFNEKNIATWAGPENDTNSLFATNMIANNTGRIYLSGLFSYRFQYRTSAQPLLSQSPATGFVASLRPPVIDITHDSNHCRGRQMILMLYPSDFDLSGTWIVELSDNKGSFEQPTYPSFDVLGPNTLAVDIDSLTKVYNNYRLRVHRTSPRASGTASEFGVAPMPTPAISEAGFQLKSNYTKNNQWYLDSQMIVGANEQYYTPTISGSYQVESANQYGCRKLSKPYEFVRSSVASKHDESEVILRGNTVTFNMPGRYDLVLTDLLGRTLASLTFISSGRERDFNINQLAPNIRGAMLLQVTGNRIAKVFKVRL